MINEIKRRLNAGETVELECVDRNRFSESLLQRTSNRDISEIVVESVNDKTQMLVLESGVRLLFTELRYFKIKEQVKTFNDLIDVAVKARKDDHIGSLTIHPLNIAFKWGGEDKLFDLNEVCEGISFFESLYTETFVIESVKDLQKTNDTSEIVTRFGDVIQGSWSELRWARHNKIEEYDKDSGSYKNHEDSVTNLLSYIFMGATVTQRKDNENKY